MIFGATADWHIRPRHFNTARRGRDFTDAAIKAIEAASAANCEFLVNGGDTFNENRPSSESVKALYEIHDVARQLGMPVLVIDGNHDYAVPSWYDTIFTQEQRQESLLRGGICRITGERMQYKGLSIAGLRAGDKDMLLHDLDHLPPTDIVLWHGAILEMAGYPGDNMPSIADIPENKFQALICGDIHKRQWVGGEGKTIIGYPGATELVKRDEPLTHSITVFDTSKGRDRWTWSEVPIETRPVYVRQVRSIEQLDKLVLELQNLPKEPWPIVLIRYDRDLPDVDLVKPRLFAALDNPAAILRAAKGPATSTLNIFSGAAGVEEPLKPPHAFLNLMQYNPAMTELLSSLCVSPADAKTKIEAWVDQEVTKIRRIHAAI